MMQKEQSNNESSVAQNRTFTPFWATDSDFPMLVARAASALDRIGRGDKPSECELESLANFAHVLSEQVKVMRGMPFVTNFIDPVSSQVLKRAYEETVGVTPHSYREFAALLTPIADSLSKAARGDCEGEDTRLVRFCIALSDYAASCRRRVAYRFAPSTQPVMNTV